MDDSANHEENVMTAEDALRLAIQMVNDANGGQQVPLDEMLDAVDRAQARILKLAARNVDDPIVKDEQPAAAPPAAIEASAEPEAERVLPPKPNPPLHAAGDADLSGEQRAEMTRLPNHLICLECGNRVGLLKPHLKKAHGMSPNEYRTRWDLPFDYAMVPQAYLDNKRAIAKRVGFGTDLRAGRPRRSVATEVDQEIARDEARRRTGSVDREALEMVAEPVSADEMRRLPGGRSD